MGRLFPNPKKFFSSQLERSTKVDWFETAVTLSLRTRYRPVRLSGNLNSRRVSPGARPGEKWAVWSRADTMVTDGRDAGQTGTAAPSIFYDGNWRDWSTGDQNSRELARSSRSKHSSADAPPDDKWWIVPCFINWTTFFSSSHDSGPSLIVRPVFSQYPWWNQGRAIRISGGSCLSRTE